MRIIPERFDGMRGLDPYTSLPTWQTLVDKKRSQSSERAPRFINTDSELKWYEYITIHPIEAEQETTVVHFDTRWHPLNTAVILQEGMPVLLAERAIVRDGEDVRSHWRLTYDTFLSRKVLYSNRKTLKRAKLFRPEKHGKWRGHRSDSNAAGNMLEEVTSLIAHYQ